MLKFPLKLGKAEGGPWDCFFAFKYYGWETEKVVAVGTGQFIMESITRSEYLICLINDIVFLKVFIKKSFFMYQLLTYVSSGRRHISWFCLWMVDLVLTETITIIMERQKDSSHRRRTWVW